MAFVIALIILALLFGGAAMVIDVDGEPGNPVSDFTSCVHNYSGDGSTATSEEVAYCAGLGQ